MARVESNDILGRKIFGIRIFGQFTSQFSIGSKNLESPVIRYEICAILDGFAGEVGITYSEFLAVRCR